MLAVGIHVPELHIKELGVFLKELTGWKNWALGSPVELTDGPLAGLQPSLKD